MYPVDSLQLIIIVAAVVPGFVYQISRRRARGPGPDEQSVSIRVLRSIATSVVFLCLYVLILDWPPFLVSVEDDGLPTSWRSAAFWGLVLVLVVPWFAARFVFYLTTAGWYTSLSTKIVDKLNLRSQWDPTPSAWDFAFLGRDAGGWVRVQTTDGVWMGGWYGADSFASSYPDPREIYLEVGYELTPDGSFTGAVSAPDGLYIRCDEIRLLDFDEDESDNSAVVTRLTWRERIKGTIERDHG